MNLINFLLECTCAGVELGDEIVSIINTIFNIIRIGIPIILIVIGMIDMGKAITQQKEDEIKKAQGLLVKKAVAAALVFLIPSIAVMLVSAVGSDDKNSFKNCVDCVLRGKEVGSCTTKKVNDKWETDEKTCAAGYDAVVDQSTGNCTCIKQK